MTTSKRVKDERIIDKESLENPIEIRRNFRFLPFLRKIYLSSKRGPQENDEIVNREENENFISELLKMTSLWLFSDRYARILLL